jgi:iron complex transport system ATP-binding protein
MEALLEIKDLVAGYPSFFLKDINLSVSKGEFCGIIGPNGSGKTTLLKTISGIIRPLKGKIYLKGREIKEISRKEFARSIASVSQVLPQENLRAEEYVLLGRIPHFRRFQFFETPRDREFALKCMELTGVLHLRDRIVGELSSGERQLLFIARGLAQEPEILLLDEPVAHLDIAHQIQVMDLLKRLNSELGLTMLIVLHDLNLAGEYCDRLILLKEGSIYRYGTPSEVITYQTIEEVYRTVVIVRENPLSKKPFVLPIPSRYISV